VDPEVLLARARDVLVLETPSEFAFKRSQCLDRIRALEGFCTTEEALLNVFLEHVRRNVQWFVELPSTVGASGVAMDMKAREKEFSEYADKACESRQRLQVKMREAYPLLCAIAKSLQRIHSMDSKEATRKAGEGMAIACPKCGEYNEDARYAVLCAGEGGAFESFKSVSFGGPKIASVAQGRCPGCGGEAVDVEFDPGRAGTWAVTNSAGQTITAQTLTSKAARVESDDDAIKSVFTMKCQCHGSYRLIYYHRNPQVPNDPAAALQATLDKRPGSSGTYDVIKAQCVSCNRVEFFIFAPLKIHKEVAELMQRNQEFIRV
jgi:hypothetical protein